MPTAVSARPRPAPPPLVSRETHEAARLAVRDLLARSESFKTLNETDRRELAQGLVRIGGYLAEPDGVRLRPEQMSPQVRTLADPQAPPPQQFGQATRTGVEQMIAMVKGVDFPGFVSALIQGVFHSIVDSSIQQMKAYGELVANVAKSLDQFRDDNTTDNQGRDHLIDQFPDVFELSTDGGDSFGSDAGPPQPRVTVRSDVDEGSAVARINRTLPLAKPLSGLDDDTAESTLVPAARQQLATGRQQLLATMVLMGINRIVVTDGKIAAKVSFDFTAKDNRKYRYSATQFDHEKDAQGNLQLTNASQGTYESKSEGGSDDRNSDGSTSKRDGNYYAKGDYQFSQQPVVKLTSTTALMDDSQLQTKAQLVGNVEVNFKSDYLPLEKMATPENIAAIQMRAQPAAPKSASAQSGGGASSGGTGSANPSTAAPPGPAAAPATPAR